MAQQNIDYGELFCAAVDTIVQERLTHVSYDRTILCTIVDDSERAQGLYTVTENDSTKFIAYSSDTSYRNGQNVYVQIPGGDWNQQKIIVAKKSDNTIEPYVYQKPFSSLVDITGNVISNSLKVNGTGLIANACTAGLDTNNDPLQSVTLWSYNSGDADVDALIEDQGNGLSGYTRLGIQASFQSWLNPFYINVEGNQEESSIARIINQGEYGLRLRVRSAGEAISKDDDNKDNISIYDLYLNQEDMNGNPYDFETYFTQEKVFDITALGKIVQMELQFYQIPRTFKDNDGNEIPYKNFLGQLIKPNLYVKDVYISLGYDVSQFDEEMIKIYTLDSTTYSRTADPLSNHKEIQLRWIQKQADGSFKSITEKDNLDYELRWYRYKLGASSADPYSGVYWSSLSTQKKDDEMWQYTIEDNEWELYNKTSAPEDWRKPGFFSTWLLPDTTLQDEQVKAILLYNGKVYRSNVLYCTNEDEVVSKPTVDAVQALSVNCDDDTFGNYRIYNLGNMLIDYAQGQKVRTWTPYFKSSLDAADAAPKILTEAESIEWIIPIDKTMIVLDEDFKSGGTEDEEGRIHIVRTAQQADISEINTQKYRIRSYYSQNYSNNTIQCKIVKDKITYTATKELTFGPAGTTGTDATFVLDFDNGVTAVTLGENPPETVVTARLYDYENNEIKISNYDIKWSWKNSLTDIGKSELIEHYDYSNDGENVIKYKQELKIKSGVSESDIINNFHILQATLSGWGDYDLIAYLPIPIRTSKEYSHIAGTTQILYESSGEILDYFKNPYAIFDMQGNAIDGVSWAGDKVVSNGTSAYTYIHNGTIGEEKYTPQIYYSRKENNYSLQPLTIYVENASNYLAVHAKKNGQIIWSQPILVLQNRYPAAMVNKWDGALKVDEANNAILAAKFVAGRKESNNTFTGVMMGDWGTENAEQSIINNTGIFGFHQGEQSFGFKDDGTAFLGKSGTGRIEFDGTQGIIQSAVYNTGQGMRIDLSQGTIDAHKFDLTAGSLSRNNSIHISTNLSKDPLSIGSLFYVEWDGTVHATDGDFSGHIDATSGTLGDLEVTGNITVSGSIKGSNWKIEAGSANFDYITANQGGEIGGWSIHQGYLSYGNSLFLKGKTGEIYSSNNAFKFDADGFLTALSGNIGGCTLGSTYLSSKGGNTTTGWVINSDGSAYFNNVTVRGTIASGSSITCGTGSPPPFQVTAAGVMTAYSAQLYDLTVYKSLTVAKGTGTGNFSVAGASTLTGDTTIGGKLKINAGTLNRSEQLIIGGTSYLGGSTYVKGDIIMDAGSRGNIRSSAGEKNYISFGASDSGHGGGVWIYGEITSLKAGRVDIGSGEGATTNFYGKVVTDGKETKTTTFTIGNASLDFSRGFLVGVKGQDAQGNISVQVLPECSANDSGKVLTATGKNTYAWSHLKKKFDITITGTFTVKDENYYSVTEYKPPYYAESEYVYYMSAAADDRYDIDYYAVLDKDGKYLRRESIYSYQDPDDYWDYYEYIGTKPQQNSYSRIYTDLYTTDSSFSKTYKLKAVANNKTLTLEGGGDGEFNIEFTTTGTFTENN